MVRSDIVQKSKKQSSFSAVNSRGQATVEYVLILIVTVGLLLALIYQVFKPFQSFVQSYMGDYTACLLETGELPSLGNTDAESALSDEGCNSKFEAATLANGRPPVTNSSSSTSSSTTANSSSSSSSSDSGGGTTVSPGSATNGNNNLLVSSMKKKTGTESGSGASQKVTEIPVDSESKFYNRKDSYSKEGVVRNDKTTYVGIAGMTEEEKKKQERQEGKGRIIASGEFGGPLKKIAVKPPPAKPLVEDEDTPMTFGNFFRILLIAAIIIALIVVLGSQALKIAKSQEK